MTTVAYRDGVIASDSGMTMGSSRIPGWITKIARNVDGDLAGCCGRACFTSAFLRWFLHGQAETLFPKFNSDEGDKAFIVRVAKPDVIEMWEDGISFEIAGAAYFALGSGRPTALGAMFAGADPTKAVEAALRYDDGTFGDVVFLRAAGEGL